MSGKELRMVGQPAQVTKKAARKQAVSPSPDATPAASGKAGLMKLTRGNPDIGRALAALAEQGMVAGVRSTKISARVDPGLLLAAATRLGLAETEVSDVVNASLALAAAPDSFKAWLRDPGDPLPDDFELAV
jgi:hypothetical protein